MISLSWEFYKLVYQLTRKLASSLKIPWVEEMIKKYDSLSRETGTIVCRSMALVSKALNWWYWDAPFSSCTIISQNFKSSAPSPNIPSCCKVAIFYSTALYVIWFVALKSKWLVVQISWSALGEVTIQARWYPAAASGKSLKPSLGS